jgi:hypothetical protein
MMLQPSRSDSDRVVVVKLRLWIRAQACKPSSYEFDGFVILEAPDETTVTAFPLAAMSSSARGVLMRPGAIVEAMKKAGGVEYKGPKK